VYAGPYKRKKCVTLFNSKKEMERILTFEGGSDLCKEELTHIPHGAGGILIGQGCSLLSAWLYLGHRKRNKGVDSTAEGSRG